MSERTLLLVSVSTAEREVFRAHARRNRLSVLESTGELACVSGRSDVILCVVDVPGGDDAVFERVRSVQKSVKPAPVVVLAHDLGASMGARLAGLGVAEVLDLPMPGEDMIAKSFRHLADAGAARGGNGITGESEAMRCIREQARTVARTRSTVLLIGETGTGKGLVARRIHDLSSSNGQPFIHVDCAALSPTVIESELFGHERGAFTGASGLRRGRFELAERGTVFLDEIGDLDTFLQAKLLRILQDRTYERVGGTRTLEMMARVIAATNQDLVRAVREGRFRADLFYRLNVFEIRIPPLRERKSDIPVLVRTGLDRLAGSLGVPAPRVSDAFYECLLRHDWPGNVRELLNVLERCLVQRRVETLEPEDLEDALGVGTGLGPEIVPETPARGAEERHRIARVLREVGGNVTRAARRLGIPRGTLRHKIKRYRLGSLIPRD